MGPKPDDVKEIVDSYSQKLKTADITLLMHDVENRKKYVVANNTKIDSNRYLIILHEYDEKLLDSRFETYFCNNIYELKEILNYICDNLQIFVREKSEDVMDNCEVISLDSLTEDKAEMVLYNSKNFS